jgi:hypothetical protein
MFLIRIEPFIPSVVTLVSGEKQEPTQRAVQGIIQARNTAKGGPGNSIRGQHASEHAASHARKIGPLRVYGQINVAIKNRPKIFLGIFEFLLLNIGTLLLKNTVV